MDLLQTHIISYPYCGENKEMIVNYSETEQDYVESCQVCCRPINFYINVMDEGVDIIVTSENELKTIYCRAVTNLIYALRQAAVATPSCLLPNRVYPLQR